MRNSLVGSLVIQAYAIAGGVGAAFYTEATNTQALDILVLPPERGEELGYRSVIEDALQAPGSPPDPSPLDGAVWPVHITLPEGNPLISEAIREAKNVELYGTAGGHLHRHSAGADVLRGRQG